MHLPLPHNMQARRGMATCRKKHEGCQPANFQAPTTNVAPQADEVEGISGANVEECHPFPQPEVSESLRQAAGTDHLHQEAVKMTAEHVGVGQTGVPSLGVPRHDTGGSIREGQCICPAVELIQSAEPRGCGSFEGTNSPVPSPVQALGAGAATDSPVGTNLSQKTSISLLQLAGAEARALATNQNDVDDNTGTQVLCRMQRVCLDHGL